VLARVDLIALNRKRLVPFDDELKGSRTLGKAWSFGTEQYIPSLLASQVPLLEDSFPPP
jgi:hypothetical protein